MADYDQICDSMVVQLYERAKYRLYGKKLKLTQNEQMMLKLTWNTWVGSDPTDRGFQMFLRMFKNHPETQDMFNFAKGSSAAQMQNSSRLLFHVARVVKYLTKVVDNLDCLEEVVPTLKLLGGKHGVSGYNVPGNFFPYLGVAMRELMKQSLGNWTHQHEDVWTRLYDWVVEVMREGQLEYGKF